MNFFYNNTDETKNFSIYVNWLINQFNKKVIDNKLQGFILSFWIVGPCARWQWFWINENNRSDIDFYLVSSHFSISKTNRIKSIFYSIFPKEEDFSIHYASPTIFKRPDLMFFEYTNSGYIIIWKKLKKLNIVKVPRFECFKNIIFRGGFFFEMFELTNWKLKIKDYISNEEFLYWYSKIIFSIWEIILILQNIYKADNFKRNKLLLKLDEVEKKILNRHNEMHNFRYHNEVDNNFDIETYTKEAFHFIEEWYLMLFNNLYNWDITRFKRSSTIWIRYLFNRLVFSYRYYKITWKIHISINEPFIDLSLLTYDLVKKINNSEVISSKLFNDFFIYWKNAPFFYYKINK